MPGNLLRPMLRECSSLNDAISRTIREALSNRRARWETALLLALLNSALEEQLRAVQRAEDAA